MRRALPFVCLLAAGCVVPPERLALRPLPADGPPLTYAETILRARNQATVANEAFYVNNWGDLEDAARGLEDTARHLTKATDVPVRHKDTLAVHSSDLGKQAEQLREAARARDVKRTNDILQLVNLKVRELRPEN
jgi:hypothetical protein